MKIVKRDVNDRIYYNGNETVSRFKNKLIDKIQSKILHRLENEIEAREVAICINDIVDEMVGVLYVSIDTDPIAFRHIPLTHIESQNIHRASHLMVEELIKNGYINMTKSDYFHTIRYEVSAPFIKDTKK